MIKFAIAGTLDYRTKAEYLIKAGYIPAFFIDGKTDKIENHFKGLEGTELLVCLAYPDILKKPTLSFFPKGCINFHYGLPYYQGRHPLNWMLIDGIREIPCAIHYMTEDIDSGDIIVQDTVLVKRDDNYKTISDKLTIIGSELLLTAIKQIESNTVYRCRQKPELFHYTRKRTPEDSKINWKNMSSIEIHNFVKALVEPMPNAYMEMENSKIVRFKNSYIGDKPNEVLAEIRPLVYIISTKDGIAKVETDQKLNVGDLIA
jgi:methionyl-tRNA formyltransferase